MKKTIVWILVLISLAALLIRFSPKIGEILFGIKQTGGISIQSTPEGAVVFLDNKEVGTTPFEDKNLDVKQYNIKLEKDGATFQGNINLTAGTMALVNRDLAKDPASQAGETLTLEKGKGITVISNPSDSEVDIDGKKVGKTPIKLEAEVGEHTILVSHPNYLKRSIKASLPKGFNLTISVDLALSEADLTQISAPVITQTQEVEVINTPTGFLRVRDQASLQGKEIGRVSTGDTLVLLEELGSWYRVRLSSGVEGFVSSQYVQKKTQ